MGALGRSENLLGGQQKLGVREGGVGRIHVVLVPDAVAVVVKREVACLYLKEFHAQWKKSLDALNDLPHASVDHLDNAVVESIGYQKFFSDDPRTEVDHLVDATM